ncbi:MAG: DUF4855 domain-containing protein, partial [Clostridia bacterium]|nr:DUF4855 domain-containing protein [Clostridia bacterium]
DAATIKGSAELAAGLGVDLCWIPYYQARSYDLWADMGFDCAVMQPNYVFKEEVPYSQLVSAASLIRNNGMGIEIEISARALSSQIYTERYLAYLGYGLEAGYMSGCIHMYYQEGSVFRTACKSKSPLERIIYDATYRFIKGTLTGPEKPEDMEISVLKDGVSDGSLWDAGELGSAELLTSAAHGSVSLAPNGSYVYVPYKGYTGSDSFTFRVSNAIGWSEPVTVRLNVS